MSESFLSDNVISIILQKLLKELNLHDDHNVKEKCRDYVIAVLNEENMDEFENEENFINEMVDKCKQKYLQRLGYYKNQTKDNIFFDDNNVKKISRDLMEELGIKSEEDFIICKTFVAIVMRMIFSEQSHNINEVDEKILDTLNKKT